MDTKLMNTPVTNFEALVGQARDCGLTKTFATAYEVNKALDEADCCGGAGGKIVIGDDIKLGYSSFKEVPDCFDFSQTTDFGHMFQSCTNLSTISQLDTSKGDNLNNMFLYCSSLENITFTGSINKDISFNNCTSLTYESVKSILTACSNTTRTTASKTITFNRTLTDQDGELAALVSTCNSKSWTINGLTLN